MLDKHRYVSKRQLMNGKSKFLKKINQLFESLVDIK